MGTNSPQVALFFALFSKNIAKFKAQNEGQSQATYGDMVNVFEERNNNN